MSIQVWQEAEIWSRPTKHWQKADNAKTKTLPGYIAAHLAINVLCRLKPQPAEDEKYYMEQKLFHPLMPAKPASSEP